MKKQAFLILCLILQTLASLGQFSVKIVNENFNSNMMRWDIHKDENSEMAIQNGKYMLSCLKEGTAITSSIEVPHLQSKNYSITASFLKLKGIDDNGYGLVWGSMDANNEFEFVISGNGQFKIIQWEQGNKTELVPWTYSSEINKWDFSKNILCIKNVNKVLKFYINETYIAAVEEMPTFGNRVGFVLNENIQVEIDNIIIENMTINEEIISDNIQNLEITKIDYIANGSANELKYNESSSLTIQIKNQGNIINNLILFIEPFERIYGLEFNPITRIEKLDANEVKTLIIKLNANEELPSKNNIINISVQNLNRHKLDSENFYLKTVGISTYYQNNDLNISKTEENTAGTTLENKYNTNKNNMDGCTKGCSVVGLISLLTGLILAIL